MTEGKKTPPSLTPPTGGRPPKAPKAEAVPKAPKAPKESKPPKTPKEPKAVKESAGAGAPRPRKHEYGIKNDALVVVVAEQADAAKRAGVAQAYEHAKANEDGSPITVEAFYTRGGDRHDLRVMSRRGLIKIRWVTGEEFPQAAKPKELAAPLPSDAAPTGEASTGDTAGTNFDPSTGEPTGTVVAAPDAPVSHIE